VKKISVVSGTYNRLPLLRRYVQSVRKSVGALEYEIILVGVKGDTETLEWCRAQGDVKLIVQEGLLGAIKAFNAGAWAADPDSEYVCLFNDDIVVEGKSCYSAYQYLEEHPQTAMIAFAHKYQRRGGDKTKGRVQGAMGYPYGQCCMVRRWMGDYAGWWGTEGMKTYGGDTRLSLRLWEMGYPTSAIPECSVIDFEHDDELRRINNDTPQNNPTHPDLVIFNKHWKGRMPPRKQWKPATFDLGHRILEKAAKGTLRTMRFKAMMGPKDEMRTGLIDAFSKYGPTKQVNQVAIVHSMGLQRFQGEATRLATEFKPDLLLIQAQRPNNFMPHTVASLRQKLPGTYIINWDGDTHPKLEQFHFDMAKSCHLQLVVSPTVFPRYFKHGAYNIGYWPIGIEEVYLDPKRVDPEQQSPDVIFLAALYGVGVFPEAETRRDAVRILMQQKDIKTEVYGHGWQTIGIQTSHTSEKHSKSAHLYAGAKMALSISQSKDLWGYTSDRAYNIMATACPILVQRFAGMEEHGFIDGESCIAWGDLNGMIQKVRYYLDDAHTLERERIGRKGKELIETRHNWRQRVLDLFAILEGIEYNGYV
jgi:glycosyltransferase involved in cell wall biosynthesis